MKALVVQRPTLLTVSCRFLFPPPHPQEKTSTSYPKTSPHQISHHQCVNPRIDSLDSTHLESKCSGPLHKDSHPKPASDRVLTPSRSHISSPLTTAREQRPYRTPNRNVTHVIRGPRSWSTKSHILQNKQDTYIYMCVYISDDLVIESLTVEHVDHSRVWMSTCFSPSN